LTVQTIITFVYKKKTKPKRREEARSQRRLEAAEVAREVLPSGVVTGFPKVCCPLTCAGVKHAATLGHTEPLEELVGAAQKPGVVVQVRPGGNG